MSCLNDNKAVEGKVYSSIDRPPRKKCGGDYIDYSKPDAPECSYWGKSRTVQADEVNSLQNVMARGGVLQQKATPPIYADHANMPDYKAALNLVIQAESQFMSLDASLRAKFDNDPAKLLGFLDDAKNDDEAIKLGLKAAKLHVNTPVDASGKPMASSTAVQAGDAVKA